MGNAACTIGIQTDQQRYSAGSTVTGRVYVSVNDHNGIQASALNVRFCGEEHATVHYTTESYNNHSHNHNRRENGTAVTVHQYDRRSVSLVNFDVSIATFPNGRIFKGQYEYPFQFDLPPNLPSTMFYRWGESKCRISYDISAYTKKHGGGMFPSNWVNTSSSKQYLTINGGNASNVSSSAFGPIVIPPEMENVRGCCCVNRGYMTLSSETDKGVLSPGETMEVAFQCKNDSTVEVKDVKVMLTQKIVWRGHYRHEEREEVLAQNIIPSNSIPELKPLFRLPTRYQMREEMNAYNMLQKHSVSLMLPFSSKGTYSGTIIEIQHALVVRLVTPCCISSPESYSLITVLEGSREGASAVSSAEDVGMAWHEGSNFSGQQQAHQTFHPDPSAPPIDTFDGNGDEPVSNIPQAVALPPDWSPHTADMVTLPVVQATVVGVVSNSSQGVPGTAATTAYAAASAPPMANHVKNPL